MVLKKVTENFNKYEYSKARKEIDDLFWNVFTNYYLEIVKKRVYQGKGDKKLSAQYALYFGFLKILKMWAPIVPFIVEEIYLENYFEKEKDESIHLSKWPEIVEGEKDLGLWDKLIEVIDKVRQVKSENKKAMNSSINLTLFKEDFDLLKDVLDDLKDVVGAEEIVEGDFKVSFLSQ